MKKMMVVLAVAALSLVAQANLVPNGEFDEGQGAWGCNGSGADWSNRGTGQSNFHAYDGLNICAIGWWNWASIWQETTGVIEENTVYTLTVRAQTDSSGDGVVMTIQDVSNGWAVIVPDTTIQFPAEDMGTGVWGPYRDFSISFDSTGHPELVGHKMGVGVRLYDIANSWGWMYVDSVTLVPEPATMVLLGLGALVSLRKRK